MNANFTCNSVRKTGMVHFVLLILAFCMVNVGHINSAFADHSTETNAKKVSTVWIRAEDSYKYFLKPTWSQSKSIKNCSP